MDKLQAMATFVRVVETGSFSAVAREQGATQSAVSKQVAALERALGAPLLIRSTRALSLTEEGQRYFEQVRRIIGEVSEAESVFRLGEAQLSGWLRIAASVAFGRLRLMPVVQAFMHQHPNLKVDLRLDDGFVDLIEQGVDVAVRIGELSDSSLIARQVATCSRILVAHRDYLETLPPALREPQHPRDLSQLNCIVYTELATRNAWTFLPIQAEHPGSAAACTVEVTGRLQTNSSEVVRAAVLGGMGVACTPNWLFLAELEGGELLRLLPTWEVPDLPIHLVSPPGRHLSAKVRAFGTSVAAALGDRSIGN